MARTQNTDRSDKAREYRKKHGMEMPTLKLARIMYAENKLVFSSVEDARSALRYIEGKKGSRGRVRLGKKAGEFLMEEDRPRNPYKLPKSDETIYEPFFIKGHRRVAILSDLHIPYHAIDPLTIAITYLKKQKPDAILLNGDAIDCHRLSRFIKDPKKREFAGEIAAFKEFFDVLEKQLKCKIYYKLGNHEERYEHFLHEKAKELVGIEEFEFANILKARARGIEVIADRRVIKLNSLNGIHGHEYIGGISVPVNAARGLFLRAKASSFQSHIHATSNHTETDIEGKVTSTWSVACLCELHPAYMPLNKWNWGFAECDLDQNGKDFEFRNHTIYKGKVF